MLIEKIELRIIKLKLKEPFETSFGREHVKKALILKIEAGGIEGFGECVAMDGPWYNYETIDTCIYMLKKFLAPLILHKDVWHPSEVISLSERIRGHNMAKAALEMAIWDLYAKEQMVSLKTALGGVREKIEAGVSIGIQRNITHLIKLIEKYLSEGYKRIKIKIKPGWDVRVVSEIRDVFPEIPLTVDANGAYTLNDLEVFKKLDKYDLMMIEQPLNYDDLYYHSILQKNILTPICLDESITSPMKAEKAIKMGSAKIINIKPGRLGGHMLSRRTHDICDAYNVPVWIGGMLETGIGRAHNAALASLPNFKLPGDISASDRYFDEDIVEPEFKLNPNGTINVPKGEGIGVEIKWDLIDKITEKKIVLD